jgi:hypothetical protein
MECERRSAAYRVKTKFLNEFSVAPCSQIDRGPESIAFRGEASNEKFRIVATSLLFDSKTLYDPGSEKISHDHLSLRAAADMIFTIDTDLHHIIEVP